MSGRRARSQARSASVIARRRLVSIRPKAELFARRRRALCPGAKRPYSDAPVLLPAVGGSQMGRRLNVVLAVGELFVRARSACILPAVGGVSIRPKVLLAVGELFVWARSACSQGRSVYVIARRRWVSIGLKAESFARRSRAQCSGAKRSACVIARRRRVSI